MPRFVLLLAVSLFNIQCSGRAPLNDLANANTRDSSISFTAFQAQLQMYTGKYGLNTRICFLLDLSIPNGKKRFFVYDMHKDSIVNAGLVTHGDCGEKYLPEVKYSNRVGSQCSSMGKYKVGTRYSGIFGRSYKLHGLDSSNSKAYNRAIVIHSHNCIPEQEIYPDQICNSQGCTTISPGFMGIVGQYADNSVKPILLWVLEPRRQ